MEITPVEQVEIPLAGAGISPGLPLPGMAHLDDGDLEISATRPSFNERLLNSEISSQSFYGTSPRHGGIPSMDRKSKSVVQGESTMLGVGNGDCRAEGEAESAKEAKEQVSRGEGE
eukprot:CAMPEP_0175042220 /NCGR_PEP_ID=MMETSP0052_2-20121109/2425_1 /TAXON_ID=51329 ORGANISM="Polytomella parva, Strain SAG 63-3" /NCGR_SAMPLE_ID=MMETSP0052_2 /ASSEMBLY_ACC=CAM_ASM_000194 /LENGTH=115 /DNA_ID=CAMNT_0016304973 /DNA_START=386 /DNA_END=730 /DNA_ORIENTATION=-